MVNANVRAAVLLLLLNAATTAADAQPTRAGMTDWGGGYLRGPDSASTTIATSGAGPNKPAAPAPPAASVAPVAPATPAARPPLTDWGGGYWRGPDSASTTPATSGAGGVKPVK